MTDWRTAERRLEDHFRARGWQIRTQTDDGNHWAVIYVGATDEDEDEAHEVGVNITALARDLTDWKFDA